MRRLRSSALWLAAILVIAGSSLGFAQTGEKPHEDGAEVSETAPEVELPETDEAGEQSKDEAAGSHERKINHGFSVSQAAHCEDVDDPATPESPDFAAPDDCDGAGHGAYVSSVAKSSLGKKDKSEKKAGGE